MPTAITGDYVRLAQAILCRALEDATSADPDVRSAAQHWLTFEGNQLRELILEATTDIHQDWINEYVQEIEE